MWDKKIRYNVRKSIADSRGRVKVKFIKDNTDMEPKRKKRKVSASGFHGVKETPAERYQARLYYNGKQKTLGTFDAAKEAARVSDQAVLKYNKSTAFLNIPQQSISATKKNMSLDTGKAQAITPFKSYRSAGKEEKTHNAEH